MLTLMLMSWPKQIRSLTAAIDELILRGHLLESTYVVWETRALSSLSDLNLEIVASLNVMEIKVSLKRNK